MGLPEWAVPTPGGYCHRCGTAPGEAWHPHDDSGWCRMSAGLVGPEDPAALMDRAVMGVLQDDLQAGHFTPGGLLDPAVAARALTRITDTIGIYTDDSGVS